LRAQLAERHGRAIPGVAVQNPVVEFDRVMTILEERHKLPRRIVLTRWLSCADAVRVILNCRDVYTNFVSNETTTGAGDILELLEDSSVMAWFACMQDVLPVLTGLNVLFQLSKPLPHLLFSKISSAKSAQINMVGNGTVRTQLIPIASVGIDTSLGAFANKFIRDHSGDAARHHRNRREANSRRSFAVEKTIPYTV
jgi:hypothetical protein